MEREQMIYELAKKMCNSKTCKLKKDNRHCYVNCNAYIYATRAIDSGVKFITKGAVVLTEEEYIELKQRLEKVHDEMDERMKEELVIEKRIGEQKAEKARNETARKIFSAIDKYSDKCFETVDAGIDCESYDYFDYCKFFRWFEKYAKKFGVEVE